MNQENRKPALALTPYLRHEPDDGVDLTIVQRVDLQPCMPKIRNETWAATNRLARWWYFPPYWANQFLSFA